MMEWILGLLFFLVLLIIGSLIYCKSLNTGIKKGLEYERLCLDIFQGLKRDHPDLSIEKAKAMIYAAMEEKWFLSLNMETIEKLKKYIFQQIKMNEGISEEELKQFVMRIKANN